MVDSAEKKIDISFDDKKALKRWISPTMTIGELITKAKGWFKIQDEITDLVLELEGSTLNPTKKADDYPNLFTQPCRLRISRQSILSFIKFSINSSEEKTLQVDLSLPISEVAKLVFTEMPRTYVVQIDEIMIDPKTILNDIPQLNEVSIEIFTQNVQNIRVNIQNNDQNNLEETYSVNKTSTIKDITSYILGIKKLDPKLYVPTIDGETIEGSRILKDIEDLSSLTIEFQKINAASLSEDKEPKRAKSEVKQNIRDQQQKEKNPPEEQKNNQQPNIPIQKKDIFFSFEPKKMKITVSPGEKIVGIKRKIQQLLSDEDDLLIFYNSSLLSQDTCLHDLKNIENSALVVEIEEKHILYLKRRSDSLIFSIPAKSSSKLEILRTKIHKFFNIKASLQVWMLNSEIIKTEDKVSVSDTTIPLPNSKENPIEVFEFDYPLERKFIIVKVSPNGKDVQSVLLDSAKKVKTLKESLSSIWGFGPAHKLICKSQTGDALDEEIPLCAQIDRFSAITVEVKISKEVTIVAKNRVFTIELPYDVEVVKLKEMVYPNPIEIPPKYQKWIKNGEIEDSKTLYEFGVNQNLAICIEESEIRKKNQRNISFRLWNIKMQQFDDHELSVDLPSGPNSIEIKLQFCRSFHLNEEEYCLHQGCSGHADIPKPPGEEKTPEPIKIFPIKKFCIVYRTIKKEIAISLGLLVKDVIQKIRDELELENSDFELLIDKTKLSDDNSFYDYSNFCHDSHTCEITVVSKIQLNIIFEKSSHSISIKDNQTIDDLVTSLRDSISDKSGYLEFYYSNTRLDSTEFDQLLKKFDGKVLELHCFRGTELTIEPEELAETKSQPKPIKIFTLTGVLIKDLTLEVIKKLQLESFVVKLMYNDKELPDDLSVDEYLKTYQCNQIKCRLFTKVQINWENISTIQYFDSTMTVEFVVKALKKEIPDIHKKELFYKGKSLPLASKLHEHGIFGGDHIINVQNKPSLVIEYLQKTFEFPLEQGSTREDLESAISDHTTIAANKQLVIITKNGVYIGILTPSCKKLSDLVNLAECSSYKILVKRKFPREILLPDSLKSCVDLASGEVISVQKRILELESKIPADKQEWIREKKGTTEILSDDATLESYDIDGDQVIKVAKKLTLNLCMAEAEPIIMENILSIDPINKAKRQIEKQIEISQAEQKWFYEEKEIIKEMSDEKRFEDYVMKDKFDLAIDVVSLIDFDYFGFNEASPINPDLFTNFYLESNEDIDNIIEQTVFDSKKDDVQFRNKMLSPFFAVLKKYAPWEHLINAIKDKVYEKKKIKLWKGKRFNTEYLLSYILNSKIPKLNFGMLSLLKNHIPIPLTMRTWIKRHKPEKVEVLDDVYWLVQPCFTITSVGVGDEKNKAKGKSFLNNLVFFTNFLLESQRNPVCEGCTEIKFDIYKNEKVLVNFIEIADETEEIVKNKILKSSNLLVIHSTLEDEKLDTLVESMKGDNTTPTIIFRRDVNNAFENPTLFTEKLEQSFEKAKQSNKLDIDVENLSNIDISNSNEIKLIYKVVHNYIMANFKKSSSEDLWKFTSFFDGYNNVAFKTILTSIENASSSLCNATKAFDEYISIQRNNALDSETKQKKSQTLIESLQKEGLSPQLQELVSFIYSSQFKENQKYPENPSLILVKLQNFLRNMKIKQTMNFYKLYTFHFDLTSKVLTKPEIILDNFSEYWKELKNKSSYFNALQLPLDKSVKNFSEFIRTCIDIFEQKYLPEIFSMELLWREMIYMTSLLPTFEISDSSTNHSIKMNLEQVLVDLSKGRVQDGFPFEIIDGDLLYMPKEFLKKVFGNFKDNAVVVTVLGPQSSGKSTLLNFLFGCDFSTSSGRCTKGIYGTFLKLSNFNTCGGVLLLDTEGLFGLLNKTESNQRDKFDRKLVLFCLAISDVVLVNFRGDIDKTLTDLLSVTLKDSLVKLQQGNTILPEMMLILNQNAQTNIETQLQDINKMAEFGFSVDDVAVLPLAFDTKEIKLEVLPDPIIKKEPRSEFSEKCRNITDKIFKKIGAKQIKQRTLEEIFDTMEKIWETMAKYPQLLKHSTLKDKEVEESMKNWVNKNVDKKWRLHLNEEFSKYKGQPKNNLGWEEEFVKDIKNQENDLKEKFKNNFEKISENHTSLYSEHEDYLQQHLNQVKQDIHFELNKEAHNKKIKNFNIEGEDHIKQAIREAKKNPNISQEEKQNLFDAAWNKVLSESLFSFDRKKEGETLFKIICEKYQTSLINLTGGLPDKLLADLDFEVKSDEYQKRLIDQIQNMYLNGGLEESKGVPSRVLDGGITNVSFKYFDMRKYFNLADLPEKIVINRPDLCEIIDIGKISATADALFLGPSNTHLSKMVEEIDRTFQRFGFTLDQQSLKKYLEYKMNSWFARNTFFLEPEIVKYSGFPEINNDEVYSEFVNVSDLKTWVENYVAYHKITMKHFIKKALECIEFDYIKELLTKAREESYQNAKIDELINAINDDFRKINCKLLTDRSKFTQFLNSGHLGMHLGALIHDFVTIDEDLRLELQDITQQTFTYVRSNKLAGLATKIKPPEYNKRSCLLIGNSTSTNYQVKEEYSSITWLEYYAKNDFRNMINHSSQNRNLHKFVSQEFDLKKLLKDIFECCNHYLGKNSQESFNSISLYQNISNDVNNLIGHANNDLQQACYKLDFNISANVHLSVVYLIWKYFEEFNWNRINQPLTEMKNQVEKQRKFFLAMTSQDKITIANAEVEDFSEKLIKYWKDEYLIEIKKNLINRLAEKFNEEGKRAKIQKEIDEKYFGRGAQINLDELYKYICDPHKILEAHYTELIDKYVKNMRSELIKDTQAINKLMTTLKDRIISLLENLNKYTDDSFDHYNLYQPKQLQNVQSNEVFYQKHDEELRKLNFEIFVELFTGNAEIFNKEYKLNQNITVIINPSHKFSKLAEFKDPEILKLLAYLADNLPGILNVLNFLTILVEKIDAITEKLFDLKIDNEDIENFKNLINYHICKQKCPCCDRICGDDGPLHRYHRCKYGHQMRAIGGIKLNDGSASVSRCEDIGLHDLMHYNGAQKTWMEFKEEMKNHPNNPWEFDDLEDTKRDTEMKERFKYAWTLVGQKICSERFKGDLRYVEYNQGNLDKQKRTQPPPKTYIFIIDSSGSMAERNKWNDLLAALKTNLGVVHSQNKDNKVTIINFSSNILVEFSDTSADKILGQILEAPLTFQAQGTNFEAALQTGLNEMKKNILGSYSMIFLSDGECSYPQVAINAIKNHISGPAAGKFEFTGLEFQCTSDSIKRMCDELNGKKVFVADGAQLSSAFYEVITKKI